MHEDDYTVRTSLEGEQWQGLGSNLSGFYTVDALGRLWLQQFAERVRFGPPMTAEVAWIHPIERKRNLITLIFSL